MKNKIDFLFELGVEEIPAGYIHNAVEKFRDSFISDLSEYKLSFERVEMFSTPRRFAIKILSLESCQEDELIEKSGPAKKVAYDDSGNLTKAGLGFLCGAQASVDDLYILSTAKGEYIAVKVFLKGKATVELLPKMMNNAIERIVFPKTMKWGEGSFLFARPIRWIVGMVQGSGCSTLLPYEFQGLKAGCISYGNRFEMLDNVITVESVDCYPEILKKVKVVADRDERKNIIRKQIESLSRNDFMVSEDERLLDTVVDLVEWPTVVVAGFSEKYLALPSKIITSTLSQNQKYFTVVDKEGNLKNEFVFISNGDPAFSDIIKIGNEKVVAARLEDAQFYFSEDTKRPFEEYVPKLADVVFHGKLGTLLEKTERVVSLCRWIASFLAKTDKGFSVDLERAAYLSKADLVTLMLGEKEFTKLQGYVGMNYALISGEKPSVARALYEHYMPRGQNDELPSETIGALLAIADKVDTICGIIGVGLIPTGSNDPFALRRAANGVVQILDKYEFDLTISTLIDKEFECLGSKILDVEKSTKIVYDFFKQRIRWLLEEIHSVEYDVIDALEIFKWENVADIRNRAIDLQHFKKEKDFQVLVSGFKRVSNILEKNTVEVEFKANVLKEDAEITLYKHFEKLRIEIEPLLDKMLYKEIMAKIVTIGGVIDGFFDKVLVMCDDKELKNNRLALLMKIRELFLKVADISRIVYETE